MRCVGGCVVDDLWAAVAGDLLGKMRGMQVCAASLNVKVREGA
jgi:hypothetical protein